MLLESANGNIDVKSPNGTVTIEQKTIKLNGNEVDITAATIKLTGHVIIVGAMDQSGGVHTDPNGHHTTSRAERDELLARIEALERRVTQLEARHGS
jgi:phage baseplate assembly protein gpV